MDLRSRMGSLSMDDNRWRTVQRRRKSQNTKAGRNTASKPIQQQVAQDDESWVVKVSDWTTRLEPDIRTVEELTFSAPHRRDLIFRHARAAVIAYNRSSLAKFCDPLRLEAFSETVTSFDEAESGIQKLGLKYKNVVVRIPFNLVQKGTRTGTTRKDSTLLCDMWPGWQRFEDYLASLSLLHVSALQELCGDYGELQQRKWWSKNGKSFKIMDLPAELRGLIIKQAIGFLHYPTGDEARFRQGPFWFCGNGSMSRKYGRRGFNMDDPTKEVVPAPDCTVLLAHPQLYYEVKSHLRQTVPKVFEFPRILDEWVIHVLLHTPMGFNSLQHLKLDFDHEYYIDFFGVDVPPFQAANNPQATMLARLPALKKLRINFHSPVNSTYDDPWGRKGALNGYQETSDFQGYGHYCGFLTSCQKILIDWVLTFTKDYIQHVPTVDLTGYIKTSTKAKWDRILEDERFGIRHDMSEEKWHIRNWPRGDLPPQCKCSTLCAYSGQSVVAHFLNCQIQECEICRSASRRGYHQRCSSWDYQFDYDD